MVATDAMCWNPRNAADAFAQSLAWILANRVEGVGSSKFQFVDKQYFTQYVIGSLQPDFARWWEKPVKDSSTAFRTTGYKKPKNQFPLTSPDPSLLRASQCWESG